MVRKYKITHVYSEAGKGETRMYGGPLQLLLMRISVTDAIASKSNRDCTMLDTCPIQIIRKLLTTEYIVIYMKTMFENSQRKQRQCTAV